MKYSSRKFLLASFFSASGFILALMDKMDGSTYVTMATLILGVYGAANVMSERSNKNVDNP